MASSIVITHGDCDGIISAYLYIKHFMKDMWPSNVSVIFTQPWRANIDFMRGYREGVDEVVLLDLALSSELVKEIIRVGSNLRKITIVDHHISSLEFVNQITSNLLKNAKVVCEKTQSCPRLMITSLKISPNPYEKLLVDVADVCEGGEASSTEVTKLADIIKLSIARDPGDYDFMNYLLTLLMKNRDVESDSIVSKRYKTAKFILSRLLKIMSENAISYRNVVKISTLTVPESRIFAGLLGVGTTELARMYKSDIVLVRSEENKVVVTVRTLDDKALKLCRDIAKLGKGRFGGHAEAASATLPELSLQEVTDLIVGVVSGREGILQRKHKA
ncbi:MAG: DHHA1 domain-containing protein [Desulfurococcaceae archaeon TW002]